MSVAENLKARRKAKGYTQKQLADASGVSQQAISFIENKRNTPSEGTMRLLAAALTCTVAELLGEDRDAPAAQTDPETQLLTYFRRLNAEGRTALLERAEEMLETRKFTQPDTQGQTG